MLVEIRGDGTGIHEPYCGGQGRWWTTLRKAVADATLAKERGE